MLFIRDTLKIQERKRIESKRMEKDIPHKQWARESWSSYINIRQNKYWKEYY